MRAEYAQAAPEEQEIEVGGECQGLIRLDLPPSIFKLLTF
jgi:hypothetical protein